MGQTNTQRNVSWRHAFAALVSDGLWLQDANTNSEKVRVLIPCMKRPFAPCTQLQAHWPLTLCPKGVNEVSQRTNLTF